MKVAVPGHALARYLVMPARQCNIAGNDLLVGDDNLPSPALQSLVRGEWVKVKKAATLVASLLLELAARAVKSPERIAAWSPRTIILAGKAAEAIGNLPLYGGYSAAKVLRITMAWYFKTLKVTMPPGALSVN